MKKNLILILIAVFSINLKSQSFNTGLAYSSNFEDHILEFNINYNFKLYFFNTKKVIETGFGINYTKDNKLLYDTKISFALAEKEICRFYWVENFATWFVSVHYRYSNNADIKIISPELGYNYLWPRSRFCFTPSINYYINSGLNKQWEKNIHVTFTVKYVFLKIITRKG